MLENYYEAINMAKNKEKEAQFKNTFVFYLDESRSFSIRGGATLNITNLWNSIDFSTFVLKSTIL